MDDNLIYYLVIGAIYLISRLLKKKKAVKPIAPTSTINETEDYQEQIPQQQDTQKPASFEDMLKEISQEYTDKKEPEPTIAEVEEPVELTEPIIEKEELTTEQKYVKKRKEEIAKEDRRRELRRLEVEEDGHDSHDVLELLREEGGAANAIILSEIMNRKY